jgi:hypothetical protein
MATDEIIEDSLNSENDLAIRFPPPLAPSK